LKQFIRKRRDNAFVLKPKHEGALASNGVKQPLPRYQCFFASEPRKGVTARN
jgi:hypothetical protein